MEQLKISINIIFVFQKLLIFNFRKYRFKKYQPSPLLTSTLIVSIFVFILLGFFFFSLLFLCISILLNIYLTKTKSYQMIVFELYFLPCKLRISFHVYKYKFAIIIFSGS